MADPSSRMLQLLSLLQARRDWPGAALSERLDVSARTVRRDIDRLRELGYRIRAMKGPDGGYRLDAGSELPPLLFDDDQAVAVAIALQTVASAGAGVEEAAERALTTIRQVMPSRLRHRIDGFAFTAAPPAASASLAPAVLLAVSDAVRERVVLRFDYTGDAAPRRAEPHHLVARTGRWYLVAWDLDRDDWRIYRADRIAPRTPTGPRFTAREVPGGDVAAFLAARFRGSDDDGWPCRGEVILGLPLTEVAPFAGDGVVEAVDERRSRLRAGSWSWPALAAALARFDTDIEVVGPPELASAFGRLAEIRSRAAR
jgi:predicted DNA-binding transcriptional regulator YafY